LDSSFNNGHGVPGAPANPAGNGEPKPAEVKPAEPRSPAMEKFQSCRWRKPAETPQPEHCTHRDVLPMAGMTGFVPDSWCTDCSYYKAKRSPRKRQESDVDSNANWRW
jgi:hypothetical protein